MLDADADLGAVRDEAVRVLAAWGMTPTEIQVVGAVPGMAGTILRPVVDLRGGRYLLRRQPPGLTAADLRFRHAFMDHLARAGLPAPTLLPRPDGRMSPGSTSETATPVDASSTRSAMTSASSAAFVAE